MKKTAAVLIIVMAFLLSASSCGEETKIEGHTWRLSSIQSSNDGRVIAYSPSSLFGGAVAYPDAAIVEMSLSAEDGRITILDETNGKSYTGTYSLDNITPDSRNYRITVEGREGYCGVAMTTYADGSKTPTLPITLGEYSLCFYAD